MPSSIADGMAGVSVNLWGHGYAIEGLPRPAWYGATAEERSALARAREVWVRDRTIQILAFVISALPWLGAAAMVVCIPDDTSTKLAWMLVLVVAGAAFAEPLEELIQHALERWL